MMSEEKVEHSYDESDIQVLEGLEAVRKRPGMYIGTTSIRGLHHLVWEIVDNSIDEALAGYASHIRVILKDDDVVQVIDDGRGMPTGTHAKTGISTVETIFTVLHAGGKFGGGGYKVSGGLHGVGASVVNALSQWLEVKVYRDGHIYFQRFENGGKPVDELKIIGESEITGTVVTFKADKLIFKEGTVYDYDTLRQRIRELAFLNKGLRLSLEDNRNGADHKHEYYFEGGIKEYVAYINKNKTPIHEEVIYVEDVQQDITIEVAMQYNDGYQSNIYSFCNNINTHEGGTHEEGFRLALTRVINNYAKNKGVLKKDEEALSGDDGLTLVEYCPFGVIGAIAPTTNPTETVICNSIAMLAGGNTVVFSPHPRSKGVSIWLIKKLNAKLEELGAPRNLIVTVKEPSIENTNIMMNHPKVRMLVATGGPGIVKAVMSTGKKAIGAGAGNPPVVVDETADIEKAAKDIVNGCSFDNNLPCIAEKEVIAVDQIADYLIFNMKNNGAYEVKDPEIIEKMVDLVTKDRKKPAVNFVGKSAQYILDKVGIKVGPEVKCIIMEAPKDHPFVQIELMMPILPIVRVPNVDEAIDFAVEVEHGNRHTAMMHSKNVDKLTKMAKEIETTIFVKNGPSYAGIGVGGMGYTTFTIAGPTGEGLTSAKSFCRKRRCVLQDGLHIRMK